VYHNGTANVFITWKYTTSKLYKLGSVRRTKTQEVASTENFDFDMEDKTFSIFGYEEGAGLQEPSNDTPGDPKIDAHIFDVPINNNNHFSER
jgi:hypothetical protein